MARRSRPWKRHVLLTLVLLLAPWAAGTAGGPARLETWRSEELSLRITPPRGWTMASEVSSDALLLIPPGGKGQFAVAGFPLPDEGDDLDSVADSTVESLKASIKGFKLLSRREVEVAGLPARELYFRGRVDREKFRWVQTLFVRGDRLVIVMYTAPQERYTRFLGDYDRTLRSVQLLP